MSLLCKKVHFESCETNVCAKTLPDCFPVMISTTVSAGCHSLSLQGIAFGRCSIHTVATVGHRSRRRKLHRFLDRARSTSLSRRSMQPAPNGENRGVQSRIGDIPVAAHVWTVSHTRERLAWLQMRNLKAGLSCSGVE